MSRRIALVLLAASAALTATHAWADPECFADSCRLPAVVEPPPVAPPPAAMAAAPLPAPVVAPAPSAPASTPAVLAPAVAMAPPKVSEPAREALAQPAPKPTVYPREAARAPRPVRNPIGLAPSSERPQLAVQPVRDYEAPALRTAEVLPARQSSARVTSHVEQGSIDNGPIFGVPYAPGAVVVGVPAVVYGGVPVRSVYLVAPSAKIIHIDRDE